MPEYELNDEAESLSVMTSTNIEVTLKKNKIKSGATTDMLSGKMTGNSKFMKII